MNLHVPIRIVLPLLILLSLITLPASAAQKYCAKYTTTNTPSLVLQGQTAKVDVTVENCGTMTWKAKHPNKVLLSYHWYQGNKVFQWNVKRFPLQKDISKGKIAKFAVSIKAPAKIGEYTLKWDLVRVDKNKKNHWFSKKGVMTKNEKITVMAPIFVEVMKFIKPTIKSIYYPDIQPDRQGLVFGKGFGNSTGKLKMTLPSGKTMNLDILKWTPLIIHFKVPPVSGEKDGTAKIWVETAQKYLSNTILPAFKASRTIKRVEAGLKTVHCADPLLCWDNCYVNTFVGIMGSHRTDCCFSGDDGTDKYKFANPLKNGWVFEKHSFAWWVAYGKNQPWYSGKTLKCLGSACPYSSITVTGGKGATNVDIEVYWDTGNVGNKLLYYVDIFIKGPKGVPYQ